MSISMLVTMEKIWRLFQHFLGTVQTPDCPRWRERSKIGFLIPFWVRIFDKSRVCLEDCTLILRDLSWAPITITITFSKWDLQNLHRTCVCVCVCVCVCARTVVKSCLILFNPMDCSPPGSSVYGVFQTRILEWISISFCRESAWPRDRTCVSSAGRVFTIAPPAKPYAEHT